MASAQRHPDPDLKPLSPARPAFPSSDQLQQLGFFGAVALLERLTPRAARVGGLEFSREAIRFHHDGALSFSVQDLKAVERKDGAEGDPHFALTATFLGLSGGVSPTPAYLSEELLREEGQAQRDFLDIFHHRLLSLLYRELARLKPWAEQRTSLEDDWSARLLALAGIDVRGSELPADRRPLWLQLLPLLGRRLRSGGSLATALEMALQPQFPEDPPRVVVREFAGLWSRVAPETQSQLGRGSARLGQDCLLGGRVWDPAGAFEIEVGPLRQSAFQSFRSPRGPLQLVHEVVGRWLRDPLEYRVLVWLRPDQLAPLRLGIPEGGQLGRDALLGRRAQLSAVQVHPA